MACTLGWVAWLSQLAFRGKNNPNFPWEKSHLDNTVVKSKAEKKSLKSIVYSILYVLHVHMLQAHTAEQ